MPIAAYAKVDGERLELEGLVGEVDGSRLIRQSISGSLEQAETLGVKLAESILDAGGQEILQWLYAS